jgi:hypothetical protein
MNCHYWAADWFYAGHAAADIGIGVAAIMFGIAAVIAALRFQCFPECTTYSYPA